jgi:hypothetical protein
VFIFISGSCTASSADWAVGDWFDKCDIGNGNKPVALGKPSGFGAAKDEGESINDGAVFGSDENLIAAGKRETEDLVGVLVDEEFKFAWAHEWFCIGVLLRSPKWCDESHTIS